MLNILEHPNDNGIILFVLGILFLLSVYHIILYFQQRDRTYLYYGLFAFTGFVAHVLNDRNGFIHELIKPISGILSQSGFALIWINSLLYFIFGFTFVGLKNYSVKWYKFIFYSVYILMAASIVISYTGGKYVLINGTYMMFLSVVAVLSIISYIPLFKLHHPLKKYIIVGSIIFFTTSIAATFIIPTMGDIGHSVFYIGLIIENMIFSLGLGHKQKLIAQQRIEAQEELINQLQENEKLKNEVHKQLKMEVTTYSSLAEKEKLEKLEAKYEKEFAELRISSLRSQMNPHFIFNSLNAIKLYVIDNDKENAVYYLNKFSKLIRKILSTTRQKEISLSEELETLKLYLEIENIRFSNSINVKFDVENNISMEMIKIPSLILQPFVENALWHGFAMKEGDRTLKIGVRKEHDSHIIITIEDNGIGREKALKAKQKKLITRESIGIQLTKDRLDNFSKEYENKHSLELIDLHDDNNKPCGTVVVMKIPVY